MLTFYIQIGIFMIALVMVIFNKIYKDRNEYKDCRLFSRLLLALIAIILVDTLGWVVDGNPFMGQIWITSLIDGLDLFLTTGVCWCWLQYTLFIIDDVKYVKRSSSKDFSILFLIIQFIMVIVSQWTGLYYYIDEAGVYHRGEWYLIHTIISMSLLAYSSFTSIKAFAREQIKERKKELLFIAFVICIPFLGNIFQLFVYGFPTVWLCMVYMVLFIYIHIQNKRINEERQEQNKMLKEALIQARLANDEKTQFLARMSHDMRTPMNGILGLTYLMEEENGLEQIKRELPKIRHSGEYLLQLINDVLDVNKVESGKVELHPKKCDEEQLFLSIIDMVKPLMDEKKLDFHFVQRNIAWKYMSLDVQRVKQIFVNLLTNAAKYTPEGGRVDFEMELFSEDKHMIRDKFVIRDNGIGMSEEFLPNIFKPFSQENRLHENLGGTGLGLSIVKSLVELMNGEITVKSKINEGTEFTLYLDFPLVDGPVEQEAEEKNGKTEFPKNLRILLCEDHPLNAEIASRLLKSKNAEVVWKENGQLGVEAFMESKPNYFDLILMDIRMPIMDGIEATKNIRALERADAKTIPIIAMTANAYKEDIRKSLEAGMNAHLAKPVDPTKMFDAISKEVVKER